MVAGIRRTVRILAVKQIYSAFVFNILGDLKSGDPNADKKAMGPIASLSSGYLQSVLNSVLQSSGLTGTTKKSQGSSALSSGLQPDNTQLSPYAQITTELQQLQQSDPAKYQQVTQQIATNLQSAAQTAQASGNTTAATQLNQLATDFQNASTSGQLPNFQDLAQAASGHHHHHHHGGGSASPDSSTSATTSTSATSNSSASGSLSQLLAGLEASGTQNDSLNPMSIILNTLSTAGIGGSSEA
jgi:hypothetical protein